MVPNGYDIPPSSAATQRTTTRSVSSSTTISPWWSSRHSHRPGLTIHKLCSPQFEEPASQCPESIDEMLPLCCLDDFRICMMVLPSPYRTTLDISATRSFQIVLATTFWTSLAGKIRARIYFSDHDMLSTTLRLETSVDGGGKK